MAFDLAELRVVIKAEFSEYTAGLRKATEELRHFSDDVGSAVSNVAKNVLGLVALKHAFDFTETIVKSIAKFEQMSHAVGVSVEALSQLSYAAKLQGVDDIGEPLEKLARSAGSVAEGNDKAAAAFRTLGVSVTDAHGRLKTTEKLFLDVADAMSKYNDGLAKARIAQEIFGRSGDQFIALMDQGAKAIENAKQEAIALGVDSTTATAKAAVAFEQNMTRIGAALTGTLNRAAEALLPTLKKLTDQFVTFAKNKEQVESLVTVVTTGFRGMALSAIVLGEAFVIVGKALGGILAFNQAVFDASVALAEFFVHPAKAAKDMALAVEEGKQAIKGSFVDISDSLIKAIAIGNTVLGNFDAAVDTTVEHTKKLHDLPLIDEHATKGIESAIEALAKLDDKLREQIASFGLSAGAATAYDLALGKSSAAVDRLNAMSKEQIGDALQKLKNESKLSAEALSDVNAAMAAGIPPGEALRRVLLGLAADLDDLKAVEELGKLDSQLLQLTGHFVEAERAAYNLANLPIRVVLKTDEDRNILGNVDAQERMAFVTSQLNVLQREALDIQIAYTTGAQALAAAEQAAGKSEVEIAGEVAVLRQNAIEQLQELFVRTEALARASGLPEAAVAAETVRAKLNAAQLHPEIVPQLDKAKALLEQINVELGKEQVLDDALALEYARLNALRSHGQVTSLGLMVQQDKALDNEIAQLKVIQANLKEIADHNLNNPKAQQEYAAVSIKLLALQSQTEELANTLRGDFENASTDAFAQFITGTLSAGAAFRKFLTDIESQLANRFARDLMERLFGNIQDGLTGLLGGGAGAGGSAASSAAEAAKQAAKQAADLASATEAGTVLGTSITTAGSIAAEAMGTAITAAGGVAAGAMAAAMAANAAGSIGSAAGGIEGIVGAAGGGDGFGAALFSLAGITGLAGGGSVRRGTPYLVGEDGPELMVPDADGQIVPNSWRGGGGVSIVNHFHIEAPRGTVSRATQGQIAAQVAMSMAAAGGRNN